MTDRRAFLTAAGAAAVAGLTGCSAPSQPAAQGAPAASVPTSDIPVGGGRVLSNSRYVVTQPTAGVFKAFNKACTHQGCPVSDVEDGTIHCNCHGARFSMTDGSVTKGPATTGLRQATVVVEGGQVRVSGA